MGIVSTSFASRDSLRLHTPSLFFYHQTPENEQKRPLKPRHLQTFENKRRKNEINRASQEALEEGPDISFTACPEGLAKNGLWILSGAQWHAASNNIEETKATHGRGNVDSPIYLPQ